MSSEILATLPPVDADGMIEVTTTSLEMLAPPSGLHTPPPMPNPGLPLALMRLSRPTLDYYRFLFEAVGKPWLWTSRRLMPDRELAAILGNPQVEITVLHVGGEPAGFYELERQEAGTVELKFFGLRPAYIGLKLGGWLLDMAIRAAWTNGGNEAGDTRRLWVHTCTLDHPRALATYQRAGFQVFQQETGREPDPRPVWGLA